MNEICIIINRVMFCNIYGYELYEILVLTRFSILLIAYVLLLFLVLFKNKRIVFGIISAALMIQGFMITHIYNIASGYFDPENIIWIIFYLFLSVGTLFMGIAWNREQLK